MTASLALPVTGQIAFTNLCALTPATGTGSDAALVQTPDGSFYGTAQSGGVYLDQFGRGMGTLFRVLSDGTIANVHSFDWTNGAHPTADLILGRDGNYYGTTSDGGLYSTNRPYPMGFGTAFRLTPDGVFTSLASFDGTNGWWPRGGLVQGPDGNFYGTTVDGGIGFNGTDGGYGTVFRMTPEGALTTLAWFGQTNGANPFAGLVLGRDGSFYGTTRSGGVEDVGTVFKVTTNGTLTTLHSFSETNGLYPWHGLAQGLDGALYGVTAGNNGFYPNSPDQKGTVFRILTDGRFTTVAWFNGANGQLPRRLLQGTDGNFWGVTGMGGAYGQGTVFMMTPEGALTSLLSFDGSNGAGPYGALVQARDGMFYGTTLDGNNVFRFNLSGADCPRIQITTSAKGTPGLNWIPLIGRSYQLEFSTNLYQPDWKACGTSIVATNSPAVAVDANAGGLQRFYRLLLLP